MKHKNNLNKPCQHTWRRWKQIICISMTSRLWITSPGTQGYSLTASVHTKKDLLHNQTEQAVLFKYRYYGTGSSNQSKITWIICNFLTWKEDYNGTLWYFLLTHPFLGAVLSTRCINQVRISCNETSKISRHSLFTFVISIWANRGLK
jgi:hypothetical protein